MANAQSGGPLETFVEAEWRSIIVRFLRDHVRRSGAEGLVVGISGGIDSSLTAALCVDALGRDRVLGVLMPHAASDPGDEAAGHLLVDHLEIDHVVRDITGIVDSLVATVGDVEPHVLANAKARARMLVLYAEAQRAGRLVCGTGNKSELLIGYFTKYGDGGVDIEPIGDLYKTQVIELARHMGLPDALVGRTPTAGLLDGQTDEADLGMPYAALDRILKGIELNASVEEICVKTGIPSAEVARIERMVRRSEHKRHAPLVAKVGARTVGIDWRRSVHWDA